MYISTAALVEGWVPSWELLHSHSSMPS